MTIFQGLLLAVGVLFAVHLIAALLRWIGMSDGMALTILHAFAIGILCSALVKS